MPFDAIPLQFSSVFAPLFLPSTLEDPIRYRVLYGGRGSGKTTTIAETLVAKMHTERSPSGAGLRILCCREYHNSMKESVHANLVGAIEKYNLNQWFNITENSITSLVTGGEFFFRGLHNNIDGIRSMKSINYAWAEEAHNISTKSWELLDPSVREEGSEIWVSYNPHLEDDPTHKKFVINKPRSAIVIKANYTHNPWFPEVLERLRQEDLIHNPDKYDWIWEGECLVNSEATIFRNKVILDDFEAPQQTRFYHGVDWGFANDPTVMVRCWIRPRPEGGDDLMIDREAYGVGVDLDELHLLFRKVETAKPINREDQAWPIKADSARPETISYMRKQGFNIEAAEKWPGSVEDGITHLKGFRNIYIHKTNCPNTAREFRLYQYKVDKNDDVLPMVLGKHDHAPDACIAIGTLVDTHRGHIPIQDVVIGDRVRTRKGYKRVYHTQFMGNKPVWRLSSNNQELVATGDHRVFSPTRGWTALQDMRYMDDILFSAPSPVDSVERSDLILPVFDLSVEDQPEFFANGILVHNCRYALDGFIQRRGNLGSWQRLVNANRVQR